MTKIATYSLFLGLLSVCGCVQTRQSSAEQQAQQRAIQERQRQQAQAEFRQGLQMQMEDNAARLQESQQQVAQLRAELASRPDAEELRALENRIAALEQMIQRMEVQRAKDREELIETLSQRMAKVMAQQQQAQAAASARTHVVSQGETLSAIAGAWGVSSQSIIRANNISNPNALRIGQKLIIPGN